MRGAQEDDKNYVREKVLTRSWGEQYFLCPVFVLSPGGSTADAPSLSGGHATTPIDKSVKVAGGSRATSLKSTS